MISSDAATLQHFVEAWEREIVDYVEKYKDNMTARNVLTIRNVGADVAIDVVTNYDRTGPGAQIVAQGAVPESMGVKTSATKHDIFQISTGFSISKKDLTLDPTSKNRLIDIAMRDIHRMEDEICLNGVTRYNISGLITAAAANANGTITAGTNKGAWDGSDTGTDIYDDINTALGLMDDDFDPMYLLGKRTDLLYVNRMDSERQPYWKTIAPLFDKPEGNRSWLWNTNQLAAGTVYMAPKDFMAGELVVSENPTIEQLYNGGLGPGKNYFFEISEWVVPEFHNNDAFVKLVIT
jgi:uncharacterized linocin/CFP29 family protein